MLMMGMVGMVGRMDSGSKSRLRAGLPHVGALVVGARSVYLHRRAGEGGEGDDVDVGAGAGGLESAGVGMATPGSRRAQGSRR